MAKRRKVSGTGDTVITIVGLGVLIGGGYWLWTQFGGVGDRQIKDTTSAALATDLAKQTAAGNPPTLSASEAADIAAEILQVANETGTGLSQSDMDTVQNEIAKVGNLADLITVMQNFGFPTLGNTGNGLCGWTGFFCNTYSMASFVHTFMDAAHLSAINSTLSNYNIAYTF